jgi:putative ABC transport system permease protein
VFNTLNRFVLANLAYSPIRSLLSILAIAVEVSMILTLVGVSYGPLDGTARRTRGVGADIVIRPPGSSVIGLSTAPMTDKLLAVIERQPGVKLAIGRVVQPLEGLDTVTGLDLDQLNKKSGGFHFIEGEPFQMDDDIPVDEFYARQKKIHAGDSIPLLGHTWHVAGVFESGKLTRIAVRLPVLQQFTSNPNHLSQIFVKVNTSDQAQTVVAEFKNLLSGYQIYTIEEFTSLLTVNSLALLATSSGSSLRSV